jgi:hypothetical protein
MSNQNRKPEENTSVPQDEAAKSEVGGRTRKVEENTSVPQDEAEATSVPQDNT